MYAVCWYVCVDCLQKKTLSTEYTFYLGRGAVTVTPYKIRRGASLPQRFQTIGDER